MAIDLEPLISFIVKACLRIVLHEFRPSGIACPEVSNKGDLEAEAT